MAARARRPRRPGTGRVQFRPVNRPYPNQPDETMLSKTNGAGCPADRPVVTIDDCGTTDGIQITVPPKADDDTGTFRARIEGRVTLKDVVNPSSGELIVPSRGTITADTLSKIMDSGIKRLRIRSPETCAATDGVCAICSAQNVTPHSEQSSVGAAGGVPTTKRPRWLAKLARRDVVLFVLSGILAVVIAHWYFSATPGWAQDLFDKIDAEGLLRDEDAPRAIAEILGDPQDTGSYKAMAEAYSLQLEGRTAEAAVAWRVIAGAKREEDKFLAAKAWFNVGYLLGEELVDRREVIYAYSEALRLDPSMAAAYNNRGNIHSENDHHDAAMDDYGTALRLRPGFGEAHFNRGLARFRIERYGPAIEDLDEAIRLMPAYADAYFVRGLAEVHYERDASAVAYFDSAISLRPDFLSALFQRGEARVRLNQLATAIRDFTQVIQHRADFVSAYVSRGVARAMNGEYGPAFDDLDLAIRLRRNEPEGAASATAEDGYEWTRGDGVDLAAAFYFLAFLKSDRGEPDEAVVDYSEAIHLRTDFAEAYYGRGIVRYTLKRYAEAVSDFDEVMRLRPQWNDVYYYRGLANLDRGLGDEDRERYAAALNDLTSAIEKRLDGATDGSDVQMRARRPTLADMYYARGLVWDVQGEYRRAIDEYDEAVRLSPKYTDALLKRGRARVLLGDAEKGIEDYDEAIRLRPEAADAHLQRGMAKVALGQLENARVDLARAVALADETGNEGVAAEAGELLEKIEEMLEILGEMMGAVDGQLDTRPLPSELAHAFGGGTGIRI